MKATDGYYGDPWDFWKVFLAWPGTFFASEQIYWLNHICADQGSFQEGPSLLISFMAKHTLASLPPKWFHSQYISSKYIQSQRCAPMEAPTVYVTLRYRTQSLKWGKSEVLLIRTKSIRAMRAQCCREWSKASLPEMDEHLFLLPLQGLYRMLLSHSL